MTQLIDLSTRQTKNIIDLYITRACTNEFY